MRDCWMDPKGQIHIAYGSHNEFAFEYLKSENGFEKAMQIKGSRSATSALHSMGWIRIKYNTAYLPKVQILGDCIDLTKRMNNTIEPTMNTAQLRVVKKICDKMGQDFHQAINDKRFW